LPCQVLCIECLRSARPAITNLEKLSFNFRQQLASLIAVAPAPPDPNLESESVTSAEDERQWEVLDKLWVRFVAAFSCGQEAGWSEANPPGRSVIEST
jgi:hypothetical protein